MLRTTSEQHHQFCEMIESLLNQCYPLLYPSFLHLFFSDGFEDMRYHHTELKQVTQRLKAHLMADETDDTIRSLETIHAEIEQKEASLTRFLQSQQLSLSRVNRQVDSVAKKIHAIKEAHTRDLDKQRLERAHLYMTLYYKQCRLETKLKENQPERLQKLSAKLNKVKLAKDEIRYITLQKPDTTLLHELEAKHQFMQNEIGKYNALYAARASEKQAEIDRLKHIVLDATAIQQEVQSVKTKLDQFFHAINKPRTTKSLDEQAMNKILQLSNLSFATIQQVNELIQYERTNMRVPR